MNKKILQQIETNGKVCRRVCGMLYYDVAENFKSYLISLDFVEIKAPYNDIKANSRGLLPTEWYKNAVELLKSFNIFYFINRRFTYKIGLLSVPDVHAPSFVQGKKISMKDLYECFHKTYSHGLVATPFLPALNLFLGGKNKTSKMH